MDFICNVPPKWSQFRNVCLHYDFLVLGKISCWRANTLSLSSWNEKISISTLCSFVSFSLKTASQISLAQKNYKKWKSLGTAKQRFFLDFFLWFSSRKKIHIRTVSGSNRIIVDFFMLDWLQIKNSCDVGSSDRPPEASRFRFHGNLQGESQFFIPFSISRLSNASKRARGWLQRRSFSQSTKAPSGSRDGIERR